MKPINRIFNEQKDRALGIFIIESESWVALKPHNCTDHNGFGWLAGLLCGTMLVFFVDLADPFCEFAKFPFLVGVNRKDSLQKKKQTRKAQRLEK